MKSNTFLNKKTNKHTKNRNRNRTRISKIAKHKIIKGGGNAVAARNANTVADSERTPQIEIEEIIEETYDGEWNLPIMSKKYIKSVFSKTRQNIETKEHIEKYFDEYKANPHIMWCFHLMLQREHLYNTGDFAVFYHSYAESHLIFDVQTAIYELINGLEPNANRVILRLFPEDFKDITINRIKKSMDRISNRNTKIRSLILSAACSLFENNGLDEIKIFTKGYSCGDINYYSILKKILLYYNPNETEVDALITEILKSDYIKQLIKESYFKSKPFFHSLKCREKGDGQMLQIFIKKSILEEISYISESLGVPYSRDSNCMLSTNQVRILASPKYFLNPNLVRVYRYAADESIYKQRPQFISFIKDLLAKYGIGGTIN